jgi:hypothetical protein
MALRYISPFLWFLAGWQAGGLVVGLLALPTVLAFVPGIVMGLVVAWDARRTTWTRSLVQRRIRPINEFAAELDRQGDQWPATKADTRRV